MRKMIFYIIAGVIFLTLFSCEEVNDIPKSNLPLFQEGDTLLYINSTQETDTFVLRKNCDYTQWDNTFEQYCYFYYDKMNYTQSNPSYFNIFINLTNVVVYNNSCHFEYFLLLSESSGYIQDGYIYTDVFLLEDLYENNSGEFCENPETLNVWYSLQYGIIRYKTKDGEDFKLLRN